jgi:hypothetical protein
MRLFLKQDTERGRGEVAADWRNSYESLRDIYIPDRVSFDLTISRRMRWAEHVARMAEKSGAYRVLEENREGGRPLLVGGTVILEMYLKNSLGGRGLINKD